MEFLCGLRLLPPICHITFAQSPTLHTDPNDWYTDEVEECRLGVMRDVFFEAASTLTVALGNMPPHQSVFQL